MEVQEVGAYPIEELAGEVGGQHVNVPDPPVNFLANDIWTSIDEILRLVGGINASSPEKHFIEYHDSSRNHRYRRHQCNLRF